MKNPDWTEINDILESENLPEVIKQKVNLLDVMDELNIEYVNSFAGNWTHKLRCPFHSGGEERTPSMYVSATENRFKCFGCNVYGGVSNFVMLSFGCPYREALKWLVNFGGICDVEGAEFEPKQRRSPEQTPDFQALKISNMLRENLKKRKFQDKWQTWTTGRFEKLDLLLKTAAHNEWEKVAIYYERLKKIIEDKK